jgi:hypothetical protein
VRYDTGVGGRGGAAQKDFRRGEFRTLGLRGESRDGFTRGSQESLTDSSDV